jgi:hypothetical protein
LINIYKNTLLAALIAYVEKGTLWSEGSGEGIASFKSSTSESSDFVKTMKNIDKKAIVLVPKRVQQKIML